MHLGRQKLPINGGYNEGDGGDKIEHGTTTKNSAILRTYFATVWSLVDFFYM